MEEYKYIIRQINLSHTYESAKRRMEAHPDLAEKYKKAIQQHPSFKSEKEALEVAIDMVKKNNYRCQVWAETGKDEEFYFIKKELWWVIDDPHIKVAADYIGMTLVYNNDSLHAIIYDKTNIDDMVAEHERSFPYDSLNL